eukprot:1691823-Pyramimonas_sp.AAC.1
MQRRPLSCSETSHTFHAWKRACSVWFRLFVLMPFCLGGNGLFGLPLAGPIAPVHPRGYPACAWKSFARKLASE